MLDARIANGECIGVQNAFQRLALRGRVYRDCEAGRLVARRRVERERAGVSLSILVIRRRDDRRRRRNHRP